jgi:hypothetical protein
MSEIQKIAIGLLGLSHPEIYRIRSSVAVETAESAPERPAFQPTPLGKAVSALKFAFAALVTGSRAIPLGDNGRLTRELGEYGAHLKGC